MRISLALTFEVTPTPQEDVETALTSQSEQPTQVHRVAGFQIPEPPYEQLRGGPNA